VFFNPSLKVLVASATCLDTVFPWLPNRGAREMGGTVKTRKLGLDWLNAGDRLVNKLTISLNKRETRNRQQMFIAQRQTMLTPVPSCRNRPRSRWSIHKSYRHYRRACELGSFYVAKTACAHSLIPIQIANKVLSTFQGAADGD
jgi:hypothetical protein